MPKPKSASLALVFLRQFKSPFIYVLHRCRRIIRARPNSERLVHLWRLLINASIGTIQNSPPNKPQPRQENGPLRCNCNQGWKDYEHPNQRQLPETLYNSPLETKFPQTFACIPFRAYVDESLLTGGSKRRTKLLTTKIAIPLYQRVSVFGHFRRQRPRLGKVEATGVKTELVR